MINILKSFVISSLFDNLSNKNDTIIEEIDNIINNIDFIKLAEDELKDLENSLNEYTDIYECDIIYEEIDDLKIFIERIKAFNK
jgi:hypothetical protein